MSTGWMLIWISFVGRQEWMKTGKLATAGLANFSLWLGWLWSHDNFGLQWFKVVLVDPADGPLACLPTGIGVAQRLMGPETKSDRSKTADFFMASRRQMFSWRPKLFRVLTSLVGFNGFD
jgi:hypothetical protein